MNKLDIVKGVAEFAVSVGVSSIVGNAIKLTTDPAAGRAKRFAIGFGGLVLTGMITNEASKYANAHIDNVAVTLSKLNADRAKKDVDKTETEEVPE